MPINKMPPGPRQYPVIGTLLGTARYVRDPLAYYKGLADNYGDIAYLKVGKLDTFLINHPDYIRDVLVTHGRNFIKDPWTGWLKPILGNGLLTSDGEFHLRQRRLIQPAFRKQVIARYGDIMVSSAAKVRDSWKDGATLDVSREMMGLTLDVIARTMFKSDVEQQKRAVAAALDAFMQWFFLSSLPYGEQLQKLPLPVMRRFPDALKRMDTIIYRIIRQHRAEKDGEDDLLSMLLAAQDTGGNGGRMTDEQIRDEAMTIFLAGHETTANALTWTWWLLSKHPSVERQLHKELDEVLGGRQPALDDLPRLRYTEMVFSEALRLYPPAWSIARRAINDYDLAGYQVPAGAVIVMSQYVTHRDPRWWPEPNRFDPMRWTPEERARRTKFAYFPFGGGNRLCIGEHFAWMEGVLALATLAQQWQLRLAPGHKVATRPSVTLRPRGGMPMVLRRRRQPSRASEAA